MHLPVFCSSMHTRPHCVRSHQNRLFLFFSRAVQGILLWKYTTLPPPRSSRFIFFPKLNSTLGYGHFITHKKTQIDAAELPPCYSLRINLDLPNFLCLITLVWNNTGQHRLVNTNQWAAMSWYLIFLHHHRLLEVRCYSSAFLFHVSLSCTALYRVWMCFPDLCAPNLPYQSISFLGFAQVV